LLLIAAVLTGCRREPLPAGEEQPVEMGILISCPGIPGTRGSVGDIPASEAEYKIHTLQIWIFSSESHDLLYYIPLTSEEELPSPGHTRRYAIPVDAAFAHTNPLPRIDVFALGNAASVGCSLDGNSSWAAVSDALFIGDEWFGVDHPVQAVDATLGLPMTGCRRGMSLTPSEDGIVLNAGQTVEIVRAVSKIRYVFCRLKDDEDPNGEKVSIQSITLNGNQLPVAEYLFTTDAPFRIGADYESRAVTTPGPSPIAPNPSPEKLVYAGQNPVTYDQLLDDAIEDGILTDGGVFYFRESDKALSGVVNFTTDNVAHTRVFSMAAPGDFTRNHSWTLYGYFISGRKLELAISVLPWDYNHYHIDFSQGSLNAQRLLIDEHTATFVNNPDGHTDVFFRPGIPVKGSFTITSPLNGKVMINPIGEAEAFIVTPQIADINPDVNGGRIDVTIRPNPDFHGTSDEYSIVLSFTVETVDGRDISADSDINIEHYRFIR
jgi:hypothetical protein